MRRLSIALLIWVTLAVAANSADTPRDLDLVWEYPTPRATPQALLEDRTGRGLLYAALKEGGLAVLELQGERPPRQAALIAPAKLGGLHVMHLAQSANRLYLALGDFFAAGGAPAGLGIVDVSEPKAPRVLSVWKSPGKLHGAAAVLVDGDIAFLGARSTASSSSTSAIPQIPRRSRNTSQTSTSLAPTQTASNAPTPAAWPGAAICSTSPSTRGVEGSGCRRSALSARGRALPQSWDGPQAGGL